MSTAESSPTHGNERAKDLFLTGLRNAHAMEVQAAQTIETQLGRYDSYPELHARMAQDLANSKAQAARLETLLAKHGSSESSTKETITSFVGSIAGMVHVTAPDQVIKDVLAAAGYKQYEIAAYTSLIAMARAVGDTDCPAVLEQSLNEEQEMADWLRENTAALATTFMRRYANPA